MGRSLTVVVAHGAFYQRHHYGDFAEACRRVGLSRVIIPLLTSASASPPLEAFHRDVDYLRNAIERETFINGCDVLLVTHSYGSIPACEALSGVTKFDSQTGKVCGIVFVSGLIADVGQSLVTCQMGGRAPWVRTEGDLCYVENPVNTLFNESNKPWFFGLFNQAESAAKELVPHALSSFLEPTQHSAWKQYPCTYVRCLRDNANSIEQQDFFIDRLTKGATTVNTMDLEGDHCPFVSMPKKLAALVQGVADDLNKDEKRRDTVIPDACERSRSMTASLWREEIDAELDVI